MILMKVFIVMRILKQIRKMGHPTHRSTFYMSMWDGLMGKEFNSKPHLL